MKIKEIKIQKTKLAEALRGSELKTTVIIEKSKIAKVRLWRLATGRAKPYLHEARRLSEVLGMPINELFLETK